jgi:hypothetical protein
MIEAPLCQAVVSELATYAIAVVLIASLFRHRDA